MAERRVSAARSYESRARRRSLAQRVPERRRFLAIGLGVLISAHGCSPVSFALRERAAERALAQAEAARAEQHAPYELALSRIYLDKAREESAQAQYAFALRLLDQSEQSAARAQALAQARLPEAAR